MNKIFYFFVVYSTFINVFLYALPEYKMIELGVFGADESEAIAINEKNQVLGILKDKGSEFTFLWDRDKGIDIIELPSSYILKLNNKGQIGGSYDKNSSKSYIWDQSFGYMEIGSLGKGKTQIIAFNDRLQIIGNSLTCKNKQHPFLWDHGIMIDLSDLFFQQVKGNWWDNVQAVAINNKGEVVITVDQPIGNEGNYGNTRSFIYCNGTFRAVCPDISSNVKVTHLDDDGNMIAIINDQNGFFYFLNIEEEIKIPISTFGINYNKISLRNNFPVSLNCLPFSLKNDIYNKPYYSPGLWLLKLLPDNYPYFDVRNDRYTRINDQNSKGAVVGRINTYYPGFHAFLAIPIPEDPPKLIYDFPDQNFLNLGEAFSINLNSFFDTPVEGLRYQVSGLPCGVTLSDIGTINGLVFSGNVGTYTITITASHQGGAITTTFTLNLGRV